jgi:hypothetical protein
MEMPDEEPVVVYLKDLSFQVILYKQVFKNKDGSAGVRYLASLKRAMELLSAFDLGDNGLLV